MDPKVMTKMRSRILVLISIICIILLLIVGLWQINYTFDNFFFGGTSPRFAPWTLEFIGEHFIGTLPDDAINVQFTNRESAHSYALLSFSAPPQSANRFAMQFCENILYEGYDPFNSIDSTENETGYLITATHYYYFSYSPNTLTTIWGNRCFQNSRGGLLQLRLDRTNPDYYLFDLEISGYCNNLLAPHPCDGLPIGN